MDYDWNEFLKSFLCQLIQIESNKLKASIKLLNLEHSVSIAKI